MGRRIAIPVGIAAVAAIAIVLSSLGAQQVGPIRVQMGANLPNAAPACWNLRHLGKESEAEACFVKLLDSHNPAERAEGAWGIGEFKSANSEFKQAAEREPANGMVKVRWGRLFLERFNLVDAVNLFEEALELDKTNAQAMLGMALVSAESFSSKALELAHNAVEQDPNLVEARELLAGLALEDSDEEKAVSEADKALKISPNAFDALAVKAAVEALADRSPDAVLQKVWDINPHYGEAHAIVAHHLVLNRRYVDGIAHYRKAIERDPKNWAARSELGINLMRIGQDGEARQQLELCFNNKYDNNPTINSLRLLDSYANFKTYETPKTILKLHKKEADQLLVYIQPELEKAVATFEKKYKMTIGAPVQLEVYPDHEDFAVRTMGMPGLGALGVTFGTVVAMDSPSGRKPGTFHWGSTMWHELSHVFVLTATKHRVPRWFTEGFAVHEETEAAPDWGDRMTPDIIGAIKAKQLLPVADLDRGFIRPKYPQQVIVSYFQAGRICDYIQMKWNYDKLLEMMHLFGARKTTPEVIQQALGMTPEAFDKEFLAWVEKEAGTAVTQYDDWRKGMTALATLKRASDYAAIVDKAKELIAIYPDFVEPGSVYETAADAYLELKDKAGARKVLEQYANKGGKMPVTLKKLASLQEEAGDKAAAARSLNKINYIYPQKDEAMHRKLGELSLELGRTPDAIREFEAVVAGAPIDPATAHYDLAKAYLKAGKSAKAEEQVFLALEAAPGFKPAQKLMLELNANQAGQKEKQ
ncbi:MAG: tetratricopeptide repeat protein [Acidobacteriota bacterium]